MILPILSVKDVDASVAFYTGKLGFTHSFSVPGPDGRNSFAFITLGETITVGLSLEAALEHRGQGVDLMVYPPSGIDLDQFYAAARSKGVALAEEIGDRYSGRPYLYAARSGRLPHHLRPDGQAGADGRDQVAHEQRRRAVISALDPVPRGIRGVRGTEDRNWDNSSIAPVFCALYLQDAVAALCGVFAFDAQNCGFWLLWCGPHADRAPRLTPITCPR